jgi:hypothetical protein
LRICQEKLTDLQKWRRERERERERDDGVLGLVRRRSGFLSVFLLIGEVSVCVFLCLSMGTTEPLVSEVEGMSLVAREVVAKAKYSGRVIINAILGRQDGGIALIGQKVIVGGWVKTGRVVGRSTSAFLELNDGSCSANLQVVYAYFSSLFFGPLFDPFGVADGTFFFWVVLFLVEDMI